MEIYRQKRNKMIINSIFIGTIVFIIFLIWNFARKKKGNDNGDKKEKNEKKSSHKKKGKKVDNKEN